MCCTPVCLLGACSSYFPVGRSRSHTCCSWDTLCSLGFSLLCPLCSYTVAAEKEELSSLLWKFISSKEYWKTSVEFAVCLLNLGYGTIKDIRGREMVLCFQWEEYDGHGSRIIKDDSLRCGQWKMPIQNSVGVGRRRGQEDVRMANTSCLVGRPLMLAWRMRA